MKKKTDPQWKDLNPFLLCTIFSHLSLQDQLSCVPFVCHSWLSALLHSLFHHPNLDLSSLQNLDDQDAQLRQRQLSRYTHLLKLAIKHCKNWVSIYLPSRNMLDFGTLMYVAEHTPSISRVVVPCDASVDVYPIFMAVMYWKNLRAFHAPFRGFQFVMQLADYCKNIVELGLHGQFSVRDVSCIIEGFPGLKLLDMEGKDMRKDYVTFKEFRLQILEKASGINSLKMFMHCMRIRIKKPCEQCALVRFEG
ncbi:hypothetical protein POM88_004713 [Heracleum sosnowskyi]|uniref:F-box domain-containing protein n=1 Tax=Heracleum sosnowskyi TaxID=360622 RepID=A0AAD8NEP0_9APIA|nr:hypothetical protein POM88_004713 [Heracleum sosnowskyi]